MGHVSGKVRGTKKSGVKVGVARRFAQAEEGCTALVVYACQVRPVHTLAHGQGDRIAASLFGGVESTAWRRTVRIRHPYCAPTQAPQPQADSRCCQQRQHKGTGLSATPPHGV